MVRNSILFIVALILSGCSYSSPYRPTKKNELIYNKDIIFQAPDTTWKIDKEFGTKQYENWDPSIYKTLNNTQYTIDFWVHPYKNAPFYNNLFNKDAQFSDSDKKKEVYDTTDKEMGINYKKNWQVYVNGLKCSGGVYARNFGGSAYSAMSKNYSIGCGYYDKEKGKRILDISYKYLYSGADTKLEGSNNSKTQKPLTQQEAEAGLKQALKEIMQTLKIKRFDKERMIQEGLYNPEKEFKSTKW